VPGLLAPTSHGEIAGLTINGAGFWSTWPGLDSTSVIPAGRRCARQTPPALGQAQNIIGQLWDQTAGRARLPEKWRSRGDRPGLAGLVGSSPAREGPMICDNCQAVDGCRMEIH
jgi:hypothetical protein